MLWLIGIQSSKAQTFCHILKLKKFYILTEIKEEEKNIITSSLSSSIPKTLMIQSIILSTEDYSMLSKASPASFNFVLSIIL